MPTRKKAAAKRQPGRQSIPELISNPEARTYSAQQVRVIYSFYDFVLILGELAQGQGTDVQLMESARIAFSPQHAKSLMALMAAKVLEYEVEHGPIPEPKDGS